MKADNVSELEAGDKIRTNNDVTFEVDCWEETEEGTYLVIENDRGTERMSFDKAMSKAFKKGWELVEDIQEEKTMTITECNKGGEVDVQKTFTRDEFENTRIKHGRAWNSLELKESWVGDDENVVLLSKEHWLDMEEFNKFGKQSSMYGIKAGESEKAYKIRTHHEVNKSHPEQDVHEFWVPKSGVRLYELNE